MKRRTPPILLVLVASLACASPALARSDKQLATAILTEYVEAGGKINACNFTTAELKRVKAAIPVDNRQYGAALIAALDDALAARAQGACDKKKQNSSQPAVATQTPPATPPPPQASGSGATATPTPTPTAAPGVPAQAQAPPTPVAEPSPAVAIATDDAIALAARMTAADSEPPAPLLLLAVLAGLLALAALAFTLIRFFAWEPLWAVRLRHAAGEAGWRASSTFTEFTDFVRMGR